MGRERGKERIHDIVKGSFDKGKRREEDPDYKEMGARGDWNNEDFLRREMRIPNGMKADITCAHRSRLRSSIRIGVMLYYLRRSSILLTTRGGLLTEIRRY